MSRDTKTGKAQAERCTCLYHDLLDRTWRRKGTTGSQYTLSICLPSYTCSCFRYQCQLLRCQTCTLPTAAASCCCSVPCCCCCCWSGALRTTARSSELALQLSCVKLPAQVNQLVQSPARCLQRGDVMTLIAATAELQQITTGHSRCSDAYQVYVPQQACEC